MNTLHRIPGTFIENSVHETQSIGFSSAVLGNRVSLSRDFPFLLRQVHEGHKIIYLDSAATSQKPIQVIQATSDYYSHYAANVHRGVYSLSQEATDAYEAVRKKVAAFLGTSGDESEIIFTSGTTESINLVAHSWGRKNLERGDEIVVTRAEHHANFVPWQQLAKEKGLVFTIIELDAKGKPDSHAWDQAMKRAPKLVAFTGVSNVLGILWPIRELAQSAKRAGAKVLVDGAQVVPHLSIRLQDVPEIDFFAFSAHKCLGPTGVGVLYAQSAIQKEMDPYQFGGDMIRRVDDSDTVFAEAPVKFEAGTPNIAGVIGMGVALDYLTAVGIERIREHELDLLEYFAVKAKGISSLRWVGPSLEAVPVKGRSGVVSFTVEGVHPHDLATFLDLRGICIRAGHLCAQPLLRPMGVAAVNRASFYLYNMREDVDALIDGINAAVEYFT